MSFGTVRAQPAGRFRSSGPGGFGCPVPSVGGLHQAADVVPGVSVAGVIEVDAAGLRGFGAVFGGFCEGLFQGCREDRVVAGAVPFVDQQEVRPGEFQDLGLPASGSLSRRAEGTTSATSE